MTTWQAVAIGVAAFGVGFLVGRRRGWEALARCLFAEGYNIIVDEGKLHGEGRYRVTRTKVTHPPF